MADQTINLLRDLIAIDSINPSLVSGAAGENAIADAVESYLRSAGLDVQSKEVVPGRKNVVGVLEGRAPGKSLMLCGHLDTVGVAGMDQPFDPVERDGRMFGRGSGDMKGGLAAMLEAARILANNGGWTSGRLIIAAVVDEEYESIGAEALIKDWTADAAIVAEPTGLVVTVGHKGFTWVEIITTGLAAHGSRPLEGRDAIFKMGRVLNRLEQHTEKLKSSTPHPLLGCASVHASIIEGGREMSTYPDKCVLRLERRNTIGEKSNIALLEVEEILESLRKEDPEFEASASVLFERPPYETPQGHKLPELLGTAVKSKGHDDCVGGMTYWTDAAILGQAGIPSVIFGPGGGGYHGLVEYVEVDDVITCRDILMTVARDFCG